MVTDGTSAASLNAARPGGLTCGRWAAPAAFPKEVSSCGLLGVHARTAEESRDCLESPRAAFTQRAGRTYTCWSDSSQLTVNVVSSTSTRFANRDASIRPGGRVMAAHRKQARKLSAWPACAPSQGVRKSAGSTGVAFR